MNFVSCQCVSPEILFNPSVFNTDTAQIALLNLPKNIATILNSVLEDNWKIIVVILILCPLWQKKKKNKLYRTYALTEI